ncbi:hypothetical protein JCM19298_2711 [Nonlabens ulvanivorans]|nr:hypothetical protein JCM19297_926 [Nonlabens ulvanivorans]GAK92223.1 hypothetical protein JCM19298_2711 [Nonlabens ulvanivorans]
MIAVKINAIDSESAPAVDKKSALIVGLTTSNAPIIRKRYNCIHKAMESSFFFISNKLDMSWFNGFT